MNKFTQIVWHFFLASEQEFAYKDHYTTSYDSNLQSKLEFPEIFDFPPTFVEPKKYVYLLDSNFFGCFEKLWVWIVHFCCLSPTEQDYDTPWYLFFGKDFWVIFCSVLTQLFSSFFLYTPLRGTLCTHPPPKTPGIDVLYPTWALLKILDQSIKRQKSYGG